MRYILICFLVIACNQKPNTEITSTSPVRTDTVRHKFTREMVDNKKDPSCGMPVSAGIEDTVHYQGKVIGFCSDECKKQFLKDPAALVKNAELK